MFILLSQRLSLPLCNQLNEAGGMDCGPSFDHAVLRCAFILPTGNGIIISHPRTARQGYEQNSALVSCGWVGEIFLSNLILDLM